MPKKQWRKLRWEEMEQDFFVFYCVIFSNLGLCTMENMRMKAYVQGN